MLKTVTIDCAGLTISATALSGTERQLHSILELFRPYAAEFRDGFRLQVGWGPVILRADSRSSYSLLVPDYAQDAANHVVEDLSIAVWLLVTQTAVLAAAKIDAESPLGFLDSVVVNKLALDSGRWVLTRTAPRAGDSGWYVDGFPQTGDASTVEDLIKYPAHHLLRLNRNAVAVMSLPPGIGAIVNNETVECVFRESTFEILSNSPLPAVS